MAKPTPTASQIAAIETVVAEKTTQQAAFVTTAALQDDIIARNQEVDDAFSALFDYYNDDIIGQYDAERRAINGEFVPSPIAESDILSVSSNPPAGRLVPTPPATDIVRVDEFDAAGYTGTDEDNELQHISDQEATEDLLQNGITGTFPTVTGTSQTTTAVTSASTTINFTDAVGPMSFSIGDEFLLKDATAAALIRVTGVTDNMGGDPPYDFTVDIEFIVEPLGTIASGATPQMFSGFTNAERTSKTATDSQEQPIMDQLITRLEGFLNDRLDRIAEQLTALGANDDPDGVAQISTATTEANNTDTFIDNYLLTTDISDTGLASLTTERGTRSTFLSTRISEILANYTGQTENYYDSRYNTANDRGNTQRGTLRELKNAENVKTEMLSQAAALQDSIDSLNGILP